MTRILICGTYSSGSSALKDLLSEYASIKVFAGEFNDFRRNGLIGDHISGKIGDDYESRIEPYIKNNLISLFGYYPIKTENYLKYIFTSSPFRYLHHNSSMKYKRGEMLKKTRDKIASSSSFEDRVLCGAQWLEELVEMYISDNQYIIFDQPIFFNQHKNIWPKVFSPYKLLIVIRDPRDQVSDLIRRKRIFFDIETPTRGLLEVYGADILGAIKYEMDTNFSRMKNALELQQRLGSDNVLIVKFEDLVFDYHKVKYKVEDFINIDSEKHIHKLKYFDPKIGEKNVGIHKTFLSKYMEHLNFKEPLELYSQIS